MVSELSFDKIKLALSHIPDELEGKEVKVGWFDPEIAYIATIHEFGAPEQKIPARPMIAPTILNNKTEWEGMVADGVENVMQGNMSGDAMLDMLGQVVVGDIKKTISSVTSPVLKPKTIKAKGFEKPLIGETKLMFNSVSYVVDKPE